MQSLKQMHRNKRRPFNFYSNYKKNHELMSNPSLQTQKHGFDPCVELLP